MEIILVYGSKHELLMIEAHQHDLLPMVAIKKVLKNVESLHYWLSMDGPLLFYSENLVEVKIAQELLGRYGHYNEGLFFESKLKVSKTKVIKATQVFQGLIELVKLKQYRVLWSVSSHLVSTMRTEMIAAFTKNLVVDFFFNSDPSHNLRNPSQKLGSQIKN